MTPPEQAMAARLTALWNQVARAEDEALGDHLSIGSFSHLVNPLLFQLQQAEQQRDAAHAALRELREAVLSRACVESQHCGMDDDPAMLLAAAALKG